MRCLTLIFWMLLLAVPAAADDAEIRKCLEEGAGLDFVLPIIGEAVQKEHQKFQGSSAEAKTMADALFKTQQNSMAEQLIAPFRTSCLEKYNCEEARDAYQRGALPEAATTSLYELVVFVLETCGHATVKRK
jgi:hypothetical protein